MLGGLDDLERDAARARRDASPTPSGAIGPAVLGRELRGRRLVVHRPDRLGRRAERRVGRVDDRLAQDARRPDGLRPSTANWAASAWARR